MGIETTVLANTPVSVRVAVSLDPPQDRNAIIINPTLRALEKVSSDNQMDPQIDIKMTLL